MDNHLQNYIYIRQPTTGLKDNQSPPPPQKYSVLPSKTPKFFLSGTALKILPRYNLLITFRSRTLLYKGPVRLSQVSLWCAASLKLATLRECWRDVAAVAICRMKLYTFRHISHIAGSAFENLKLFKILTSTCHPSGCVWGGGGGGACLFLYQLRNSPIYCTTCCHLIMHVVLCSHRPRTTVKYSRQLYDNAQVFFV